MQQAFAGALQGWIAEQYRLLALLQLQAQHPLPTGPASGERFSAAVAALS